MATITNPTPGTHLSQGVTAGDTLTLSIGNSAANGSSISYNARWQWNLTTAESSANAGSDLAFQAIADDGFTIVATAMSVVRSTGVVTFPQGASITGNITSSGYFLRSVGNALTAVGTNRATALQLAKEINNVTTAAAGTGVVLPVGVVGMVITVYNAGANAIKVYGSGSETIDGTAGSTGVTLTNALRCQYTFVAANTWISAQLGAVSA